MTFAEYTHSRNGRDNIRAAQQNRHLPGALKSVLVLTLMTTLPGCLAQDAPASPGQTTPATQPAPSQATDNSTPSAGSIPAPRAGDPLFAPIAAGVAQTFHQRLMDYSVITFGPRALLMPAFGAAFTMLNPPKSYPNEWRQGMGAFGRNYGSSMAAHTSEQTARFLTAAVLHEDFRYRPSTSKNPLARSFHALAFTFVDKSDSGHNRIAFSNFAAAAAGGFTPNLYMPAGYDTVSRAETRMAFTFGGLAARNLTREFAPELFKATHKLHIPFPRLPVPEWWTPRP
jgi:hypothetical protein